MLFSLCARSIVETFVREMKLFSFICDVGDINDSTYNKIILDCFICYKHIFFSFLNLFSIFR